MAAPKKKYRHGPKDDKNAKSVPDEATIEKLVAGLRAKWDKATYAKRTVQPNPESILHEMPSPYPDRRGGIDHNND